MKNPRGILFRWIQELDSYDFTISHIAGKLTGAADGLSRSSHLRDPTPEEITESEEYVGVIGDDDNITESITLNRVNIKIQQQTDDVLKEVLKWVKGDPPPSKEDIRHLPEDCKVYRQYLRVLEIDEGGLLVMKAHPRFEGDDQPHRILVPESEKLRREVYQWSHAHPTAGHFGSTATCLRAAQKFFWPGLAAYLNKSVKCCDDYISK